MIKVRDNTVGSRSQTDLAYIAGFLDGDGSLMIQIKKRAGKLESGRSRFMLTICFYQDTRHEEPLHLIREILGIGYVSRRSDGMSELRVNGFRQVKEVLLMLLPYIKFKKKQANAIIHAAELLSALGRGEQVLRDLVEIILLVQSENYVTRKKRSREELQTVLGLTP